MKQNSRKIFNLRISGKKINPFTYRPFKYKEFKINILSEKSRRKKI